MAAEYTAAVAPTRPPEAARFYEKYIQNRSFFVDQVDERKVTLLAGWPFEFKRSSTETLFHRRSSTRDN